MYDATSGLLLFPMRALDPGLGRFLSEDPKPCVNPYPYVSNNPVNKTDPSGAGEGKACEFDVGMPPAWKVFEALHPFVEYFRDFLQSASAVTGADELGQQPGGTEYLLALSGVGSNYEIHHAVSKAFEKVGSLLLQASCALEGIPTGDPG